MSASISSRRRGNAAPSRATSACILIAWCASCAAPPGADGDPHHAAPSARPTPDANVTSGSPPRPATAPRTVSAHAQPAATTSPDAALRRRLRTTRIEGITFDADTGGYHDVISLLRTITGVPIVLTPEGRAAVDEEALALELEIRAPLRLHDVLDLMVERSARLDWTVQNGVVLIGSPTQATGDVVLRTHDARDLLFPRTEFLPPKIGGLPTGESTPRAGGEGDERVAAYEPDLLIDLVRQATDPDWWEHTEAASIDHTESGYLLVRAPRVMQRRVAAALDALR